MRSFRLLAVATTVLVLGSACGGDDPPTGNENEAPVANFDPPANCVVNAACNFTSTSTDDVAVTTWSWDFDGAGTAPNPTTASASFTFTAEGSFPVTLTVGDAEGLTHSVTKNVTVAPAPVGNTAPTASFTLPPECVAGTPCGFHSTSVDPDGNEDIASWSWDFGDGTEAGAGADVTHTYEEAGTYPVVLTVTDVGGLTGSSTQQLIVSAPAVTDCTTTGTVVTCSLTMTQRVTVKLTVVSEDCELSGNKLEVTVPRQQTAFFNLCNQPAGAEYTVVEANASPTVFEIGSTLTLRFTRGTPDAEDPPAGDPGIKVTGTFPNWTLNVDDGGAAGTAGEPDFNDAVLSVQATPAP
jgi:PKD repeat protein